MNPHPTTVEVETSFRLVAPDATAHPIRASLRYDPADPFAVYVLFHAETAGGEAVWWTFARELLVTGLDVPMGISDVRVWPWATPRGDFVALALSSHEGNALFEIPRSVLVRFLPHLHRGPPGPRVGAPHHRGRPSRHTGQVRSRVLELFTLPGTIHSSSVRNPGLRFINRIPPMKGLS